MIPAHRLLRHTCQRSRISNRDTTCGFAGWTQSCRIAERTHDAQQYRASRLNLVIAAIVWWNSTYMADAVAHLRASGDPAPDDLLVHTSPVGWEHIAFSGDFLWDRAAAIPVGRRQLNVGRRVRGAA